MKRRFKFDNRGANLLAGMFSICAVFMLLPMYLMGTLERLWVYYIPIFLLIWLIWCGLTKGTYVTFDEEKNKVYGTIFFIPSRATFLSKVISLKIKGSFLGILNQVYMVVKDGNGKTQERGLGSKQGFKEEDFKKLIETIRSANPNIIIPENF